MTGSVKTLDELKAENEAAEKAEQEAAAAADKKALEDDDHLDDEGGEGDGEGDLHASDDASFMETGDDGKPGDDGDGTGDDKAVERKFTDSDMKKLRVKLEKKSEKTLEEKERENKELRQQLEQYESGKSKLEPEPKEEDFNSTAEWVKAHVAWAQKKADAEHNAAMASKQLRDQQERTQAETEEKVDQHYERAATLAKKHDISVDAYRSAETNFRKAIDDVLPGVGDAIADGLIARLGDGSERVVYNLGVNAKNRAEFVEKLKSDPSGLDAYGYLVEKKSQLSASGKRRSNAPAPAKKANGDVDTRQVHDNLKKKYREAQRTGNLQKVFDARRVARQAGIPSSEINDW